MAGLTVLVDRYREQQLVRGGKVMAADKHRMREKLKRFRLELDKYLACDYGIDPDDPKRFSDWRQCHQPFHWFAEFYGVMREGGFDVVIGNPPYIQLKEIKKYQPRGYACAKCGNIYPVILERSLSLCAIGGKQGYIVPVSSISTDGYSPLQNHYRKKRVQALRWSGTYSARNISTVR
jgi:hypothetical protein